MPKIVPVEAERPKLKILRETFCAANDGQRIVAGICPSTDGFVTVEHGGHAIEKVRAVLWGSGSIFVYGFVARYQTGKKIWRASVSQLAPGDDVYVSFGKMDRNGARRKNATIWYAPKLFPTASR